MKYNEKKKNIELEFGKIIQEVNYSTINTINEPIENKNPNNHIHISNEKEIELLLKIENFEKQKHYTEKGFSMSKMASLLESNGVYINFVLQKYRGKKYSDYINEIRIKYVAKKLIDHPEYLNYKISYLSDICGFSNHSRFTQIFKKELGISPSKFIAKITEKGTRK